MRKPSSWAFPSDEQRLHVWVQVWLRRSTFGLKDGGVDLTTSNLSEDAKKAVEDAKKQIIDGSVKAPEK